MNRLRIINLFICLFLFGRLLWEISDSCFLDHYPGFRGHLLFTESLLLNTWDTNHRPCTCLPCHMTNKLVLLFRATLYYFQILIEGSSYKLNLLCLWFGVLFLSIFYSFCPWFTVSVYGFWFCPWFMVSVYGLWFLSMVFGSVHDLWFLSMVFGSVHGWWFRSMVYGNILQSYKWRKRTYLNVHKRPNTRLTLPCFIRISIENLFKIPFSFNNVWNFS